MDRSHRKPLRGSYEGRVWVCASTLRRVLAAQGLILPEAPARDPAPRVLWPDWLVWELANKSWCWDVTHFPRARRVAFAIVDVVSRRWIDTLVSIEETSTQVRVIFDRALAAEGLTELITPERVELFEQDPTEPILLACSDNGPQMTSKSHPRVLRRARCRPAPRTTPHPADQAWIESLFGHVKAEHPQLETIRDPAALETADRPPRLQHHPPPRRHRICHPQRRAHRPRRTDPPRAHQGPEASPPTAPRLPSPKPPPQQPPRAGMSWSIPQPPPRPRPAPPRRHRPHRGGPA